jgi:integrase/recombinase XerD
LVLGAIVPKNIGEKRAFSRQRKQSDETVDVAKKPKQRRLLDSMYLEEREIAAFFAVIKKRRDRAIFRLVYHRGLRAHEVGVLQLSDFRDRDGVLHVYRGKGSISRDHSLTNEELKTLRAYIKDRGTSPGPLFPSRQGRAGISRFRLDQMMKEYCRLARIPLAKAHMHALKHSCGTHLAERGASAEEIQDWLGHREASSTAIYMHFSRKRRAELDQRFKDWV